jgi:hypothetical protein
MGCLALNASFEPLTILPLRRALRLVIDRKAEILEVDRARVFRSATAELPCPVVIRLVSYVHVPRKFRRQVTNTFLFARDRYRCQYCGRHRSELGAGVPDPRPRGPHLPGRGQRLGERGHRLLALQQPEGQPSPERDRDEAAVAVPGEPNHVELVWAVRSITPVQAKYISMFYGEDVLRAIKPHLAEDGTPERHCRPPEPSGRPPFRLPGRLPPWRSRPAAKAMTNAPIIRRNGSTRPGPASSGGL